LRLRAALDRAAPDNPVELFGNDGHPDDIRNTALLETWFMGKRVYVSNVRKNEREERLVK
jgi:hypothetical protein